MGEGIPPPLALSLILADNQSEDARTRQHSLLGIISHIQAFRFPVIVPRLCIYAELTGGRGKMHMAVRLIDADEVRPPVAVMEFEAEFHDPIAINQLATGLVGLVFPEPGEYRLQLIGEGELLLERRLVVVQLPPLQPAVDGPGFGPTIEAPKRNGP